MTRSTLPQFPEYFDRYINQCDDVSIAGAITTSMDELSAVPLDLWRQLGRQRYAPGKWTIPVILQHLVDAERILCYRALAFARGESQRLPGFDEDAYALAADTGHRSLEDLIAELMTTHEAALTLFQSFTPEMLLRQGLGFKGPYSVASIGFILPGHQRWHFRVIEERYLPLLEADARTS